MKKERIPEVHFYEWGLSRWSTSMTRAQLDAAGRGIYRELLDLCYSQGSIPKDFDLLARHCGASREEFDRAWLVIKKHFTSRGKDASVLTNKFADLVRREYFTYIEAQRVKGKSSGEKRKRLVKPPVPIRYETPVHNVPDSGSEKNEPNTIQEKRFEHNTNTGSKNLSPVLKGEGDTTASGSVTQNGASAYIPPAAERFTELLAVYPNQTGTDAACRFYLSELNCSKDPESLPDKILDGIERWKASAAWRNHDTGTLQVQFIPAFHRFLGYPEEGKADRRMYLENPAPWMPRARSPAKTREEQLDEAIERKSRERGEGGHQAGA